MVNRESMLTLFLSRKELGENLETNMGDGTTREGFCEKLSLNKRIGQNKGISVIIF